MEDGKNYYDLVMRENTAVITSSGTMHKVDDLGRIVFPKTLRQKYGIIPGNVMEFYTIDVYGETYIGVKVGRNYGDKTRYIKAIEVLKDLNLEVPEALLKRAKG